MSMFGLSEGALRFSIFIAIFLIMSLLETWLPRRARRFDRTKRWPTNIGMLIAAFAAVSATTFFIPVTATLAAIFAQSQNWGLFNLTSWPAWVEWLLAFVVLDFVIWGQHVVTHKVPVLWRIHRVHHTDEDLDASSAVRFHPLEIILSLFTKSAAVLLLGANPIIVVIFEAVINGGALFNHANFRLPIWLDKWLRLLIVTPDMHRVHHSIVRRETDSNYGFGISLWDRIFGTYNDQPEKGHDDMVIGLAEWQDDAPTHFGWTILLPFRNPKKSQADQ